MALPVASSSRLASSSLSISRTALSSSSSLRPIASASFHSSPNRSKQTEAPSAEIQKARATPERGRKAPLMQGWKVYDFSEPPFVGTLQMLDMQESWTLFDKVRDNVRVLKSQRTQFRPPTSPIRVRRMIDLSQPDSPVMAKRSATIPVAALPLSSPDAIQRFKLLAGTRWFPGRKERDELDYQDTKDYNASKEDIGKQGWITISCERFDEGRMNRKFVSDALEKLVEAANDPKSPLPADLPLDTRHIIKRTKNRRFGESRPPVIERLQARRDAEKGTLQALGGEEALARLSKVDALGRKGRVVRGYPLEWLADEKLEELKAGNKRS